LLEKSGAYEDFVRAFREVKIPATYKAETRSEAETALKGIDTKIVAPLEKKSQEIAQACVDRASQFHVIGEYAAKCRSKLKKPGEGAEPSGLLPQPNYWSTRAVNLGAEVAKP
jgi:hypothetical protein